MTEEHASEAMIEWAMRVGEWSVSPAGKAAMDSIALKANAQTAAEHYWAIATSDSPEAHSDSLPYTNATEYLIRSVMEAYGMTETNARQVREYVSEYGPDDNLMWSVPGHRDMRGVASYVARVYLDRAEARKEWKRVLLRGISSQRRQDYYDARNLSTEALRREIGWSCADLYKERMLSAMITRRAAGRV